MRYLNHPNIMSLEEVYETHDSIIFVVELIKGGTMLEMIDSKGACS